MRCNFEWCLGEAEVLQIHRHSGILFAVAGVFNANLSMKSTLSLAFVEVCPSLGIGADGGVAHGGIAVKCGGS
jgi:hypothetical protein